MLEDLNLDLSVLNGGTGESDLLENISVAALTNVEYSESWVIRAFITYGITSALPSATLHPLAVDGTYDMILSSDEIESLFAALNALDGGNNYTLNDLVDSLNPETMTVNQLSLLINTGSILINQQVTEAVSAQFDINAKAIDPRVIDLRLTVPETPDLIDPLELQRLTDAIEVIDAGANQPITALITAIDPSNLTFGQMNEIVDIDSIIIHGVISENILAVELIADLNIKADAYVDQSPASMLLTKEELKSLVEALNYLKQSDDDTVLPVAEGLDPQTLSLGVIADMVAEGSLILRTLVSNQLKDTEGFEIHPDALDGDGDVNQVDLDELFEALKNSLGEGFLVEDLAGLASTITLDQMITFNAQESLIKDGMISKMVVDNIPGGASSIRTHAYDEDDLAEDEPFGLLSTTEITNMFEALYALSGENDDALLTDLMSILSNTATITIGQVKDAVSEQSVIINSMISENLIPILVLGEIHPDALEDNTTPGVVGTITEIKRPDMIDLFTALATLDENATLDDLQTLLGDTLTTTDIITMRTANSIIFEGKLSKIIESAVTTNRIVDEAYVDADPFGLLKATQIENLLNALDGFSGGGPVGAASAQLAAQASNLTVAELESMHAHDSLIIRYFISEGILAFADEDINPLAYEAGYPDEFYTALEITRIIDAIKVLTDNDLNAELQSVITGMTPANMQSAKLAQLFPVDNYSYVIQRSTSNILSGIDLTVALDITMPESAYVGNDSANLDIKDTEFRAMSNALVALGLNTLEIDTLQADTVEIIGVRTALLAESVLVNRIIAKTIANAGLNTAESHLGTEDETVDIQFEEMVNLTDAFIALEIDDIASASGEDPYQLGLAAKDIPQEDFRAYIDWSILDESQGLTIVKEFLYEMIDPIYFVGDGELNTRTELDTFIYTILV